MIRAIRPNAMAQDDAAMISGWNVAPNLAYVLRLLPGTASCGVFLYDEDGSTLIASGAAVVGIDRPCVLVPQTGQTVGMVDADFGWHLLLTTAGTESQRTIRIGPAVDLPDEIHPVYGDDDMALARATAAINAAAHYIDDVTVTCPLGLGAGLGDVASVPVDGAAVVGQVDSIMWTATPDGTTETAVIRRHVPIAPEPVVEVTPPAVADDTGTATHATGTSGNVLANDEAGLTVTAVNGLSANVGIAVDGGNGGTFTIASDGSWTFSPDGDFALLSGAETADTSVTYHASDGHAESMATLTVTVSSGSAVPWTPAMIAGAVWVDADTVTLDGAAVTAITDKIGGTIQATQGTSTARPTLVVDALNGEDVLQFDGGDWLSFGTQLGKPSNYTVFAVGMFPSVSETRYMCGAVRSDGATATAWGEVGVVATGKSQYQFGNDSAFRYGTTSNAVFAAGAWFMSCQTYASGDSLPVMHVNGTPQAVSTDGGTATSCGGTAYEFSIGQFGAYTSNALAAGSRVKGLLIAPSVLSASDRQKLEGYYAHLCSLAYLLPSDHPYKSTPPTI